LTSISIKRGFTEEVVIREIEAKSILRKHKKIDSWFVSRYGMNLYRGCAHNCVYCDGRAEKYNVEGEFGKEVSVKVNALEILKRELDPRRKRIPFKKSYFMIGGGVGDSYQPAEKKYSLTRRVLELMFERDLPVHMLTKSKLILRDLDILKEINDKSRAIVSFSLSSARDEISAVFEPGVPSPLERLQTIYQFKKEGIPCGVFLLPVIPFVTDTSELIEETVKQAAEVDVDFIVFGGMTLKDGRQKDYFLQVLKERYPELVSKYCNIYVGNKWGEASHGYYQIIEQRFNEIIKKYGIPKRIPLSLFRDVVEENDRVVVILEQLDYLLRLEGKKSPYGYAAYVLSQQREPLSKLKYRLRQLKGVSSSTESLVQEILDTGTSSQYEKLLRG
jgi:DNA repair photolyase